jgi:AraC family transcriptional regulator of arabinose operon
MAFGVASIGSPSLRYGELVASSGYSPRLTAHFELVVVRRGSARALIDGVIADEVGPSGVTLLVPGQTILHEFDADADDDTEGCWVHIPPADVSARLAARLVAVPRVIPLSEQMSRLAAALMSLKRSMLSTATDMAGHAALEMLWCYVGDAERMQERARRGGLRPDTIELAQAYIREHLDEPMTVETIARAADSSQTNLIRLFRAHVGETPYAYLWHRRLRCAIELLEGTGLTIGQVADRSGFRTSYHFSRMVKQHTGLTPTEIRRRAWMT